MGFPEEGMASGLERSTMNHATAQSFLELFESGEFDNAKDLLQRPPDLASHSDYKLYDRRRHTPEKAAAYFTNY